jgi:hypothetical protein
MRNKETFLRKGTTKADLLAGEITAISFYEEADKNDNLPHNQLTLSNLNSTVKLFVFLDDASDLSIPDYVLFPNAAMTIKNEEGVSYSTLFFKNTHGTDTLSAGELKYRISTVKEVE